MVNNWRRQLSPSFTGRRPTDLGVESTYLTGQVPDLIFQISYSFRLLNTRKNLLQDDIPSAFVQSIEYVLYGLGPSFIRVIDHAARWRCGIRAHLTLAHQQPVQVDACLAISDEGFATRDVDTVFVFPDNANVQSGQA